MMTIYEVTEALEGVGFLLEDMSDGDKEPRYWALIAAVRECVESLDDIAERLETCSQEIK